LYFVSVPFACFVLIGSVGREWGSAEALSRTFLAFLAITEVMWMYPVAGGQQMCATLLCTVAAIVSLHDGAANLAEIQWRGTPSVRMVSRLGWSAMVAVILLFGSRQAWRAFKTYRISTPLGLTGSRLIRLPRERVAELRAVTETLRDGCDTYLSFPGRNSYYFWAGKEPPTGFNVGNWMYLLTDRQLAEVRERLAKFSRPCVVINRKVMGSWMHGKPLDLAMATYVNENFQYKTMIYDNEIWVKKDTNSDRGDHSRPDLVGEIASKHRVAFPDWKAIRNPDR
jgi:hypothetical protein